MSNQLCKQARLSIKFSPWLTDNLWENFVTCPRWGVLHCKITIKKDVECSCAWYDCRLATQGKTEKEEGKTEKSWKFQVGIKPNNSLTCSFTHCKVTMYHYNIACSIVDILSYLTLNEKAHNLSSRQCKLDTLCKKNQVKRCSSSGVLVAQSLDQPYRGHRFNSDMNSERFFAALSLMLSNYHDIHTLCSLL